MEKQKIRLPKKDGGRRAAEIFERTRKKTPSDRLIKIISEIPEIPSVEKPPRDRAAKDAEV